MLSAAARKILTTPASNELVEKVKIFNNHLRMANNEAIKQYVSVILNNDTHTNKIYRHINSILKAIIHKKIAVTSEDYFYILKCGSMLCDNSLCINDNKPMDNILDKNIIGLFFINYIVKYHVPFEFKKNYIPDLYEFIRTQYTSLLSAPINNTSTHNTTALMSMTYSNLKKIMYVMKYPYDINIKIYCRLIEYFVFSGYNIKEIPADYIAHGSCLTDTELLVLEVSQRDLDILMGCNTTNIIVTNVDTIEPMIDDDKDVCIPEQGIITEDLYEVESQLNAEDISGDEYITPDDEY